LLSGLRLEVVGDKLTVTGTDLELTIQLEADVGGERDGGVAVASGETSLPCRHAEQRCILEPRPR
jgi:DNA polymerase III sliding clamp (beta) subunit (PCNA family)